MKAKSVRDKLAVPAFPDDATVAAVARGIRSTFGAHVTDLAEQLGVSIEDTIRFLPVSQKYKSEREKRGWSIKDAAARLAVPQYRLREIESGEISHLNVTFLHRYFALLSLTRWHAEWAAANTELASRLKSGEAAPKRIK